MRYVRQTAGGDETHSDIIISYRFRCNDREARLPARRRRIAGDVGTVRDARHLVADALADALDDLRDTAVLLADEIVTNAVLHGGGRFCLQVDAAPHVIRVEVTDDDPTEPRVLHASDEHEHGRGLAIVDTLATRWGTEHLGSHKVVWFELVATAAHARDTWRFVGA